MSVRRVNAQIEMLRQQPTVNADDIAELREAAGKKISNTELSLIDDFVRSARPSLTADASGELLDTFGINTPGSASLEIVSEHKIEIREASGLVHLDKDTMLIADDERGVYLYNHDGTTDKILSTKNHKSLRGIEGICLSSDGKTAYVVSESDRDVHAIEIRKDGDKYEAKKPKKLGRLPRLGRVENKGWEGLDVLPGKFSPDGEDQLIAVHEGSPTSIGLFPLPDLEPMQLLSLPAPFDKSLDDLSDIAVHPETGHIFLLSDESSTVAEVSLETNLMAGPGALLSSVTLRPLNQFELPQDGTNKPEGLSFHGDSLWVIGDGDQRLLEISVAYKD